MAGILDNPIYGRTRDGHRSICRTHIVPTLGDCPLHEVKASHIRTLIDDCSRSQTTKAHIHPCLRRALQCAVEEEIIDTNPSINVREPLKYTPRFSLLSPQDTQTLVAAKEIPNYTVVMVAMNTGMRQGELLASRWRCIDWDKRVIPVNASLGKAGEIKEVRNRENHSVKLFKATLDILGTHKDKTYQGNPDGFVFCGRDGSPMRADSVSKTFQRSLKALGINKIRFHDLRHTHATTLLNAGRLKRSKRGWATSPPRRR